MNAPRTMRRPKHAVAIAVGSFVRRLPGDVLAIVKSQLRPVGRLDYAPKTILMCLNSPWQVYRLRSCAKEPETVRWLETELRPNDTFYDIGANVGAYSLVAWAITDGQARILAFEPGFGTFAELCRNVHLNHAHESITPLAVALGDQRGLVGFRYSDTTPGAALHSWSADAPGEAHPPELILPTMTFALDELIEVLDLPQPDLLKVDVDGPELAVLIGANKTLSQPTLRSVLVELDDRSETTPKAVSLLEAKGFRVRSRHVRGGEEGPLHNVIFVRAD
jgi:FkbM family methyltransferase